MTELRDALVGGLISMAFGVGITLLLSLAVPPPLDLELMVVAIGAATFLVGFLGTYAMDQSEADEGVLGDTEDDESVLGDTEDE